MTGPGFLGSHVTDTFCPRDSRNRNRQPFAWLPGESKRSLDKSTFRLLRTGCLDLPGLRRISAGVSLIAHLAAFKIPRYGKAIDTLLVNSQGSHNLLQLATERNAKFVLASTSDVYGKNPVIPFSEDSDLVLGPSNIARWSYASSKLFDEHLVFAFADAYGIPVNVVRIFGSYGPRQNLTWWGGPQSVFIEAILRGGAVPIHGDGLQTRSFTYVSDTIRGIVAVMENGHTGELFNIGSTQEVSIIDLAKLIHRLTGVEEPLTLKFTPYNEISAGRKYEDVRRRVPDVSKAGRLLGFGAMVSLEAGLKRTIDWQRAQYKQDMLICATSPI